jgi:hypothetical protein
MDQLRRSQAKQATQAIQAIQAIQANDYDADGCVEVIAVS